MEASHTENTAVEKSVSMNTTVNGSSFWSCSGLINPEAEKIGATVSYSLSLVFALAEMHVGSWFIGGTFGQALCKLHIFLADASSFLSIQSLVSSHNYKSCVHSLNIIAMWITAMAVLSQFLVANKVV